MPEIDDSDRGVEPSASWSDVSAAAVALLARREHSQAELDRKLRNKGFPVVLVNEVIVDLAAQNLQSDSRYAEQYVRLRAEKGYGPERIRAELRERGINDRLTADGFAENPEIDWYANARKARLKKFGDGVAEDFKARAKQQRYLQYRGFSWEEIDYAIGGTD